MASDYRVLCLQLRTLLGAAVWVGGQLVLAGAGAGADGSVRLGGYPGFA